MKRPNKEKRERITETKTQYRFSNYILDRTLNIGKPDSSHKTDDTSFLLELLKGWGSIQFLSLSFHSCLCARLYTLLEPDLVNLHYHSGSYQTEQRKWIETSQRIGEKSWEKEGSFPHSFLVLATPSTLPQIRHVQASDLAFLDC